MSALALQKALRGRLTAFAPLTAVVDPANIADRHGTPTAFPCVLLGEGQEVEEEATFERRHVRIFATLHVWDRSPATVTVKAIGGAIRKALHGADLALDAGRLLDLKHASTRVLRDPGGDLAHAVVTLEAIVEEPRS